MTQVYAQSGPQSIAGRQAAEPTAPAPRPVKLRAHRAWTPYVFLMPAAVILGLFVLAPMAQVVAYSFTRYTAFTGPQWVGFENYRRLLADGRVWFCLGNSFLYLLVTPVLMSVSLLAAMVVHSGLRWAKGLRLLLFLPVVTPTIVAAVAWRLLLDENAGLVNSALAALGLDPIYWLSERPWTLLSAMMVTLWKGFGYFMMVFLAGLLAVPRELEEAASLDGAGRFRTFWHVTMPTLRPVLALVAVISSISAMKVFDELYVTIKGAPVSHQTVVPLIYDVAFERGDYGLASAIGVMLFVVILAFSLVNLQLNRER